MNDKDFPWKKVIIAVAIGVLIAFAAERVITGQAKCIQTQTEADCGSPEPDTIQ